MEDTRQIAINCVKSKLGGKAKKIIFCQFPCILVCCESYESGVQYNGDLVEYAWIDRQNGEIKWTEFADLLTEEQRNSVIRKSEIIKSEVGKYVHYIEDGTTLDDDVKRPKI